MRLSHTALSRAGSAAAAGPSTVTAPSSRHLTAKAQSIRSAPPSPFQNLVNDALQPLLSASKLFSPAPRKAVEVNVLPPARAPFEPSESSGRTLVKRTQRLSQASGSKVYNNRVHLINRLIRDNRILSAMTAFTEDVANPNRTPFAADQMENFILGMRIQSAKHATTRPAPRLSKPTDTNLWRPARLDPAIEAKSLDIPIQCAYAIAAVYDVCLQRNIQPTAKMISAMLSCFLDLLSPDQLYHATANALQHLVPPAASAAEQSAHLRRINHHALSSFIGAFGRTQKPEEGEALLGRWANAQGARDATLLHADRSIDLTGWGSSVVLWHSLIKARVDAGDLQGARTWLDRYRQATRQFPTPIKSAPYLTYMAGIRKLVDLPHLSTARIERTSSQIRDAMNLMVADHVPVDVAVVAFILSFEARVGNVAGAYKLVQHQLDGIIEAGQLHDAALLHALFSIRISAAKHTNARTSSKLKDLPSSRTLIRSLVQVGDAKVVTSTDNIAACRSRRILNAALRAAMAERDYPAAVVVLNLFERWRVNPSQSTYTFVVDPLVAHGHTLALSPESGEVKASASKLNLDTTLKSVARQGDEQARAIQRVVGDSTNGGDTMMFSAQPISTLRQTQYLVRVLNRVCAAELQIAQEEGAVPPGWLRLQENASQQDTDRWQDAESPQDVGAYEASVWKRVKSSILGAQDEMLGAVEERQDGVPASRRLIHANAPTLSPSRRGFTPVVSKRTTSPAKTAPCSAGKGPVAHARKQQHTRLSSPRSASTSARAFSTSAVTRSNPNDGAACDLASAASRGDFTHLDPVRAIYIPGFVPYDLGFALQEHLVKQRSDARAALRTLSSTTSSSASTLSGHTVISPSTSEATLHSLASQDTLLLLQHRPVYTEGRRHDSENHLVSSHLRSLGADYHLTKRGGQITYHGPGQLVGYPILNLGSMNLASRCYVDRIQDSLIGLLKSRAVETVPPPDDHTGVWADEYHKIASIGIQVRHRISSHGFALNVEKRSMAGFKHIVACGIVGRNMTCLQDRLDPNGPFEKYNTYAEGQEVDREEGVESIAESYKDHFAKVFGRQVRPAREDEFELELRDEEWRDKLRQGLGIEFGENERVVGGIKVDGKQVVVG
ncbi:Octanoyltransferase, mitochondrial [Pseudozyma hubeiensis]|nr:Octanoyltransferase, mitochondrial [Pseudozyma hubeiensis]